MVVGVPKEIKKHEYRVALTPSGARELTGDGHRILIETGAGMGSGFTDEEYATAGAEIAEKSRIFSEAGLILKVKEPLPEEYGLLRKGQVLFTYLHLAPNPELLDALMKGGVSAFAYETLLHNGELPLLKPMSEIAGRMSPLVAAYYLQKPDHGRGILPTGAAGVEPARMLILGAGVVGFNAARTAAGIGFIVTVMNRGSDRLEYVDEAFGGRVLTLPLNSKNLEDEIQRSDAVIGAVLSTGRKTPVLVSRELVGTMIPGSVIVDVSVDQGGVFETTRPTTHDDPVYIEQGVNHYTVANMPGAYPLTSTLALTNRTLPYTRQLASMGAEKAIKDDEALRSALNVYNGGITHKGLAESTGHQLVTP